MIRRYSGQGGGAANAAEHFAVKTIALVLQNLDNPSLADIQALCLLTIHEWGSRNAVRAYIYLGQAARMAQMFRIISGHQSSPLTEVDQFIKDESFRRTLWLIYILDCFLTSSPGRHPALCGDDVKDVALPCLDMSYNFGTPVSVQTLSGAPPRDAHETGGPSAEVGEFGHIVMATQAWRNVVEMLETVTIETFSDQDCLALEAEIDGVRNALPMHFMDKPGHVNLHVTMGSGYTYAMLHCLLHCATIMVNRRRLLQIVTTEGFNQEAWRMVSHSHLQTVDRVFAASHSIVQLLLALEANADKDTVLCFPLVMLFSCFTACSTVAYFSLKGLALSNVDETAEALVRDGKRFLQDGADAWALAIPWYRHLSVMVKVLRNGEKTGGVQLPHGQGPSSIKDDVASQPDNTVDAMDYDRSSSDIAHEVHESRESEPPLPRRPGITTINGSSAGASTPNTASPPPQNPTKAESPNPSSTGAAPLAEPAVSVQPRDSDMTAAELCSAFEKQLLELDDLAAFMGGGV